MSSQFGRSVNGILQGWNNSLSSIQSESFGGVEFIGKAESFKDVHLFLVVAFQNAGAFDSFLDPVALFDGANVHVFDSAAVGLLESFDYLAQCDFAWHNTGISSPDAAD
jgi:hypothetical protein